MVPEQPVQGQHVGVADEGDGVARLVHRLAVGRDLDEEPAAQTGDVSADRTQALVGARLTVSLTTGACCDK